MTTPSPFAPPHVCTGVLHADGFVKARGDCWTCWLYRKPRPDDLLDECRWLGDEVPASDRQRRQIGHARQWRYCLHPDLPMGECVCKCRGCGPGCKGYSNDPVPGLADEFAKSIPAYPDGKFAGRGVVIAAGGPYWASAFVTIRMLRHVGCELPVEVWYLGKSGERDERYEQLLAPFGVTFHDIDAHPARAARRGVKGFQTKLFAVMNSRFEEVLSLDPDNYPCEDPTPLFDLPEYRRLGGIYWPDGEHTDAWTNWTHWGVKPRGPCGLETGVYVVNKRLAWEPLKLAEWYDDRPEWCYGMPVGAAGVHGGKFVSKGDYGDKGPHRVAWAKLERDYIVFNPKVKCHGCGFLQPGPDGKTPMFVHRCLSKFTVDDAKFSTTPQHGENVRCGLPKEEQAFAFLEELQAAIGSTRRTDGV